MYFQKEIKLSTQVYTLCNYILLPYLSFTNISFVIYMIVYYFSKLIYQSVIHMLQLHPHEFVYVLQQSDIAMRLKGHFMLLVSLACSMHDMYICYGQTKGITLTA